VEVPIVFTERVQGHSKMSGHIIQEALIMVWRLWFQNNMRRRPTGKPPEPQVPATPVTGKPPASPGATVEAGSNPKTETRNPKETRDPKSENR
jgi:hypothetical protein